MKKLSLWGLIEGLGDSFFELWLGAVFIVRRHIPCARRRSQRGRLTSTRP